MTNPDTSIQIQLSGCTRSGPEKPQRFKLSGYDCAAIADASGLSERVYALEQAKGETGESHTAATETQQLRADLRATRADLAEITEMRVADALARSSSGTARSVKAETELENARAAWRNMDATVIARAEKAEAELVIAKAAIIGLQEGVRQARAAEEVLSAAQRRMRVLDVKIIDLQAAYTSLLEKDAMKGAVPLTTTTKATT